MSDVNDNDPYAVSSDSDSDTKSKKLPPKISIEGRSDADFQEIKKQLTSQKNSIIRDEKTLEEIAELKRSKAEELSKLKKDFEQGIVKNIDINNTAMTKIERPTGLDKQTLLNFKEKFEKMNFTLDMNLEERLSLIQKSLEGVNKDNLAIMKDMFEKQESKEFTKEQIEELINLQRSDADKQRVRAVFTQSNNEENQPTNCYICQKIVYPVEKIMVSKRLYHTDCFKCSKCEKKLNSITFHSHQNNLYCKQHMFEVLHPEGIANFDDQNSDSINVDSSDNEEFAITSKPKKLSADVVQSGSSNIGDELQQLKSTLKNKKQNWQQLTNETFNFVEKPKDELVDEIGVGKVKANLNKFIQGVNVDCNEEKQNKQKELDISREQVNEVKNKWKTGDLNTSKVFDKSSNEELEALKNGLKVKERFNELENLMNKEDVVKSYNPNELNTTNAAEARKSFIEGSVYQTEPTKKLSSSEFQDFNFEELQKFKEKFEKGEEHPKVSEKVIDEIGIQLKNLKEAFEKISEYETNLSPEKRAEQKRQEIEAEFLRYKIARKLQAKRKNEKSDTEQLSSEPNKWSTKKELNAENVNKKISNESSSSEDDNFDLKKIMNKFNNNENFSQNKVEKKLNELNMLSVEAKNLRKIFEQQLELNNDEEIDEKKRQLEEEFKQLKEEREKAKRFLEEERQSNENIKNQKEEIQVAADHASKMTAKWEKISKKEAKKASKSYMPQKTGVNCEEFETTQPLLLQRLEKNL